MPLGPKQQPPYYVQEPISTGQPFNTPFTVIASEESSGTSQTEVGTYEIPANTLINNGDIIILNYWGNAYNNPTLISTTVTIFGNAIVLSPYVGNSSYRITAEIIKTSTNTLRYSIQSLVNSIDPTIYQGSLGSINFTIPNETNLLLTAPTDGNVRLSAAYINILKTQ